MTNIFGAPYRPPAGGWPSVRKWFFGTAFQHKRTSESAIPSFLNVTTVADYHIPSTHPLLPYPRLDDRSAWPDPGIAGTCPGPGTQPNPSCGQVTPGAAMCGPWFTGAIDNRPAYVAGMVDRNTYAASSAGTLDFSRCHKLGFKNVQAWKSWHGRLNYLSHDAGGRPDRIASGTCLYNIEFVQSAPDATRYRTEGLSCVYDNRFYYRRAIVEEHAATATRSVTVNRYSGILTGSAAVTVTIGTDDGNAAANRDSHIGISAQSAIDWWNGMLLKWTINGWTITVTLASGVYTATGKTGAITVGTGTFAPGTGALSRTEYDSTGANVTYTESASFTATGFTHTWHTIEQGGEGEDVTVTVTGALSDGYAGSDLQDDLCGLLAQWDLTNDVVYPWRQDEQITIAPVVRWNEVPGTVTPMVAAFTGTYVDGNAARYDGTLHGAPLSAGRGPHFDWTHETWRACQNDTGTARYKYAYGAWSGAAHPAMTPGYELPDTGDATDSVVPQTATQWTQNWNDTGDLQPGLIPGWAWMRYNAGTGIMSAQKWAEIKGLRPSANFARPCEQDRLAIDPVGARCATYTAATPPRVTLDSATTIITGDGCVVAGVPSVVSGLYQVTKISSLVYELTTLAAAIPAWSLLPFNPGSGIMGKVRWATAASIGGRISVAAATQSGASVVMTLAAPALYLYSGDRVDFAGVAGLGANLAATVTDSTHISVTGTLSGSYSGGGYVAAHGAAAYQWYDDQPKGDFLTIEWQFNQRDFAEQNRINTQATTAAGCPDLPASGTVPRVVQTTHGMPQAVSALYANQQALPFSVCGPQVACISPNGEGFANGYTMAFPAALAPDSRYGSMWQAMIMQEMDDPLWLAPHKPCANNGSGSAPTCCAYVEDNIGCPANTDDCDDVCADGPGVRYYPHRPLVEAREYVPTVSMVTAPALPSDCTIYILNIGDLASSTPPSGKLLLPPGGLGYAPNTSGADPYQPIAADTAWGRYLRAMNCVCTGSNFWLAYQNNGVFC